MRIAAIGLGSMGYGMAASALKAGLIVHGFDVNADAVARFQGEGGQPGALAEVAPTIGAAMVVVLNAAQTESVLFGDDALVPKMAKGAVVIACATVPPEFAREMAARCAEHGVLYLDAPISGGSLRAADGDLTIMAAGSDEAFAAAGPALEATASNVYNMGSEIGAGSAMKAVHQVLAGVNIVTMAEAMTFGMSQGISPEKFMEIVPNCGGTSWMLENRGPHIVEGDYTPHSTVDIWLKDLGIVLDIAKNAKFGVPITAAALQQYVAASGMGHGLEDDAAVAKVYARHAGLTLPGEG